MVQDPSKEEPRHDGTRIYIPHPHAPLPNTHTRVCARANAQTCERHTLAHSRMHAQGRVHSPPPNTRTWLCLLLLRRPRPGPARLQQQVVAVAARPRRPRAGRLEGLAQQVAAVVAARGKGEERGEACRVEASGSLLPLLQGLGGGKTGVGWGGAGCGRGAACPHAHARVCRGQFCRQNPVGMCAGACNNAQRARGTHSSARATGQQERPPTGHPGRLPPSSVPQRGHLQGCRQEAQEEVLQGEGEGVAGGGGRCRVIHMSGGRVNGEAAKRMGGEGTQHKLGGSRGGDARQL